MAKYDDVYEDIEKMFVEGFVSSDLERYGLRLKVLAVPETTKDIIKPVKANDLVQYLNGIDIIMLVNQVVFDQLEELSQRILVEEAIARIKFDAEKEKLSIDKGDVHTPSLLLQKVTLPTYLAVQANVTQVLEKMKEAQKK